jgi:RecB family endonuclease NucS
VVDLLALDAKGGLVIIEVQNEQSKRAAIGQALE